MQGESVDLTRCTKGTKMAEVATRNAPSPEMIRAAVTEIEGFFEELETEKSEYMSHCRAIREKMKSAYQRAKTAGIDPTVLRVKIKTRALEAKIQALAYDLDGDQFSFLKLLDDAVDDPVKQAA